MSLLLLFLTSEPSDAPAATPDVVFTVASFVTTVTAKEFVTTVTIPPVTRETDL